jgi:hypothetical protein
VRRHLVSFKSVYIGTFTGRPWNLFFRSKSPGLLFSPTYLRGKLAPSTVPLAYARGRGFPHR